MRRKPARIRRQMRRRNKHYNRNRQTIMMTEYNQTMQNLNNESKQACKHIAFKYRIEPFMNAIACTEKPLWAIAGIQLVIIMAALIYLFFTG